MPALNSDVVWISHHGGGVLYLPAGIYRLDNAMVTFEMLSNVVLEGDGIGRTILTYGAAGKAASIGVAGTTATWLVLEPAAALCCSSRAPALRY